jgi:hypothetical protein
MRTILLLTVLLLALGCNAPVAVQNSTLEPVRSETERIATDTQPAVTLSPVATASPLPTATSLADTLPIIQPAPEIANEIWLNSAPMKLSDLRGKVVLVEFWTFG